MTTHELAHNADLRHTESLLTDIGNDNTEERKERKRGTDGRIRTFTLPGRDLLHLWQELSRNMAATPPLPMAATEAKVIHLDQEGAAPVT